MYRIIYLSAAVQQLTDEEVNSLLIKSRLFNIQRDITGILLYIDGSFLQVIEGKKENVIDLYQKIKKDSMHKKIICVYNDQTEKRQFPHWSMGFCSTTYVKLRKLSGFENFDKTFFSTINDETVSTFLDAFMRSQREKIDYV
jgi:hypothetical protein